MLSNGGIFHPYRDAPVKTVIIDCAPIGFMDAVGVKSLQQVNSNSFLDKHLPVAL